MRLQDAQERHRHRQGPMGGYGRQLVGLGLRLRNQVLPSRGVLRWHIPLNVTCRKQQLCHIPDQHIHIVGGGRLLKALIDSSGSALPAAAPLCSWGSRA